MSEMVEIVAKALEPMCRGFGSGEMPMAIAREFARAAIAAMREPTDKMVRVLLVGSDTDRLWGNIACDYRDMIDEALR